MRQISQKRTSPRTSTSKLPSTAVFGFDDTGVLNVYGSPDEAVVAWEGIDVESDVVRFYDARGVSLMPKFRTPNRSGRLFGLFRWVESGAYALVPNDKPEASFALALHETRLLEGNEWFGSIEQLKSALRANGVDVDVPSTG